MANPVSLLPPLPINVGEHDVQELSNQCWQALSRRNDPARLFRYFDALVRVVHSEDGSTVIQPLTVDTVVFEVSQVAELFSVGGRGERQLRFLPKEVAKNMLADPDPPLPILRNITHAPSFTEDARLILEPGFDSKSGTLYQPTPGACLENITEDLLGDKEWALDYLQNEWLGDFPFKSQSDRAHALAVPVTQFARNLIDGSVPLYAMSKPRAGEGGSLLATTLVYPGLGYSVARTSPPKDEGEWRRTCLSILRGRPPIILIDNVADPLASATLSSIITSERIVDRQVRSSDVIAVRASSIWIATGINLCLSDELKRRAVWIQLDSGDDHPEKRTGFRIPDLERWTKRNRFELVVAILTLIRSWIDAGRPRSPVVLGGFESFAGVVGGILEHAGVEGFLQGMPDRSLEEENKADFSRFVNLWWETHGAAPMPARDLLPLAAQSKLLDPACGAGELGRRISARQGQVVGRFAIVRSGLLHGVQRWKLAEVQHV